MIPSLLLPVVADGSPAADDGFETESSSSSTILLFFGCCLTAAVAVAIKFYMDMKAKRQQDAVPGFPSPPNSHWLFGHLIELQGGGRRPEDGTPKSFVDGYQTVYVNHADPASGRGSFWFFIKPAIYLTRGRDVKAVLSASSYRSPTSIVDVHTKEFLGRKALVNLMGKEWRLYRSAVHKSFTPRAIQQSQHIIDRVGDVLADTLLQPIHASSSSNKLSIQILPIMKMATMDVFGLAAFNFNFQCVSKLQLSPVAAAFEHLSKEYTRRLKSPWNPASWRYDIPTLANRQYQQQKSIIRTFIQQQIQKTRQDIANGKDHKDSSNDSPAGITMTSDVLTNLVKAADAEAAKEGNNKSNDEALGDVLMTLLFGGYDTTSITLTYALYLLAKHPEYEKQCLEEIRAVVGEEKGSCNNGTIEMGPDQLPYVKAVVMETLRLYPPAPVTSRTLEKSIQLPPVDGMKEELPQSLSEGQMVMIPIWCIQRDPINFPRPNEMLPERWVQKGSVKSGQSPWQERTFKDDQDEDGTPTASNDTVPAGNRDAFCVFAAGGRNCVGRILAMQEAVTLLAVLIHKLKFELLDPDYVVQPTSAAVVQQPSDGLPMIISKR
jgi:cytochrome P450